MIDRQYSSYCFLASELSIEKKIKYSRQAWGLQLIVRMHNSDPTPQNVYITFTIFYYNTISIRTLSNRIIQFTCSAVNTHLNHRRIFLFSTPSGVGSLLCMQNINWKLHWLAICCLSRIYIFFSFYSSEARKQYDEQEKNVHLSVVIKDCERDVQIWKNVKVYFKWGWT
jgi:hypothetical protein